jgi:hypothetical protein
MVTLRTAHSALSSNSSSWRIAFTAPRYRTRGAQIPIARVALPHVPPSRFPPLEVFVRRPSACAALSVFGPASENLRNSGHTQRHSGANPQAGRMFDTADTFRRAVVVTRPKLSIPVPCELEGCRVNPHPMQDHCPRGASESFACRRAWQASHRSSAVLKPTGGQLPSLRHP